MRYTPYKDCKEYYEWPNPWNIKPWFREPPKKRKIIKRPREWLDEPRVNIIGKNRCKEIKQNTIPYWRDLEKKNQIIKEKDIRFKRWLRHRRKKCDETKLPPHLCHGLRYIKITMGFPLAWRYRDMPMNLAECREVRKKEVEAAKAARKAKKAEKLAKKAAKKEEAKKSKGKRKIEKKK